MYLDEAILRVNNIKWDMVGTNVSKEEVDLGYEFLRRLANFFKDESIKPIRPFAADIARLLGDADTEINISDYCNSEVDNFLGQNMSKKNIIQYYIHLAKYADEHPHAIKYLSVYEPLIRLLEKGGMYVLRLNELEIEKVCCFPLNGWYERFILKEPIDIDEM